MNVRETDKTLIFKKIKWKINSKIYTYEKLILGITANSITAKYLKIKSL